MHRSTERVHLRNGGTSVVLDSRYSSLQDSSLHGADASVGQRLFELEIESFVSGGARVDLGILEQTDRGLSAGVAIFGHPTIEWDVLRAHAGGHERHLSAGALHAAGHRAHSHH